MSDQARPSTQQMMPTPKFMIDARNGTTLSSVVRMPKMPFRPPTTSRMPSRRRAHLIMSFSSCALWYISSALLVPISRRENFLPFLATYSEKVSPCTRPRIDTTAGSTRVKVMRTSPIWVAVGSP